jgi:dolichol-phosphate mannosyltransferase
MKLSIIIPAYNEEKNIGKCLDELLATVRDKNSIPCEIIVVNDNSNDETAKVVEQYMTQHDCVRLVNRKPPGGFGRAIRSGLDHVTGDAVVIYMADLSDDPCDVVKYYKKLAEGFDCVFGSRFVSGSVVRDYPKVKLVVNRIVNRCVQWLFYSSFNDLTNAFKAYRTSVIRECGPFRASHFNITLEMSLAVLCRKYNVAQVPISWYGRTWGSSNLRLREMGRKYLCTVLMSFFQKMLISDDLMAERLAAHTRDLESLQSIQDRLNHLESLIGRLENDPPSSPQSTEDFRATSVEREQSRFVDA